MSNTFKVGDKIKLTPREEALSVILTALVTRLTDETEFTITTVGLATHNELEELLKQPSYEPDCVAFKLKCGKEVEFNYKDISLVD